MSAIASFDNTNLTPDNGLNLFSEGWKNEDRTQFWNRIDDAASLRAREEGWTYHDCVAALFQGALLSYSSHANCEEIYGDRYVPSAPEDYRHNAPWNDWSPPSRSLQLFREAIALKKPELVDQRVRVRICASPDVAGLNKSLIAFAAVEIDTDDQKILRFRRGGDVLASIRLCSLTAISISEHFVSLVPRTRQSAKPSVYLSFEGESRKSKFCNMLKKKK
jgi:hypothetical protein